MTAQETKELQVIYEEIVKDFNDCENALSAARQEIKDLNEELQNWEDKYAILEARYDGIKGSLDNYDGE